MTVGARFALEPGRVDPPRRSAPPCSGYVPPVAFWALVLIVPLALLTANLLAAPPGQRAARLCIGHVLRTE